MVPSLHFLVDKGASHVYRQGEEIRGRLLLITDKQEDIKLLKLSFIGACITKTMRPYYVANGIESPQSQRKEYTEQTDLFNYAKTLISRSTIREGKHSWSFDFKFPVTTETRYSRWTHSSKFMKDPHPLPPSAVVYTKTSGGEGTVLYYIQAKIVQSGRQRTKRLDHMLVYYPGVRDASFDTPIITRALYAQVWESSSTTAIPRIAKNKLVNREQRKSINTLSTQKKTSTKISRLIRGVSQKNTKICSARFLPTMSLPENVVPGRPIPLSMTINNVSSGDSIVQTPAQSQYILDSLQIIISTTTQTICGKLIPHPQDIRIKQVTCISRQDINRPLTIGTPMKLTDNFRLIDDAECIPSFRTYTISRQYSMTILVGIKLENEKFTIKHKIPFQILPREQHAPRIQTHTEFDDILVDPLPLYTPRQSLMEFAPAYEEVAA